MRNDYELENTNSKFDLVWRDIPFDGKFVLKAGRNSIDSVGTIYLNRRQLLRLADQMNSIYGVGTHWIEENGEKIVEKE